MPGGGSRHTGSEGEKGPGLRVMGATGRLLIGAGEMLGAGVGRATGTAGQQ